MNDPPVEEVIVTTIVVDSIATLVAQVDGRARHESSNKRANTPCLVFGWQRRVCGEW